MHVWTLVAGCWCSLLLFAVCSLKTEQTELWASQEIPDALHDHVLGIKNLLYSIVTVTAFCSTIKVYCRSVSNKWTHELYCHQGEGWIKTAKAMMDAARGCWSWAAEHVVSGKSHETVLSWGDSQTAVLSNRVELVPFLMKGSQALP